MFSSICFEMLLPNKFVFGMWPYYEELQIKVDFGYGWMIFIEVMALDLENFSEFTVVHTFLVMLLPIAYIFCM